MVWFPPTRLNLGGAAGRRVRPGPAFKRFTHQLDFDFPPQGAGCFSQGGERDGWTRGTPASSSQSTAARLVFIRWAILDLVRDFSFTNLWSNVFR